MENTKTVSIADLIQGPSEEYQINQYILTFTDMTRGMVWVNSNKIAAVGVSSSRWITTHGLAINVSPNLDHFDKEIMIPCGIDGRGVTSMKELLEGTGDTTCPSVEEVGEVALSCFENVFNVELDRDTDPI